MAKRKADGTLNGFVINFLKNGNYERTLKGTLFEGETECLNKENSSKYEKFMKYLMVIELPSCKLLRNKSTYSSNLSLSNVKSWWMECYTRNQ